MAFVALGMEHIVVNMFFLLTGNALGAPISAMDMVFWDFLPVTIGNIIGGGFFIGSLFYFTHGSSRKLRQVVEPVAEPVIEPVMPQNGRTTSVR